MRKPILIAVAILLGLLAAGSHLARRHMAELAADALRAEAKAQGLGLDWVDLSTSLNGEIELIGVDITHRTLGRMTIPRVRVSVDLLASLDGEAHLDEILLERPRLQLSSELLGPLCSQTGLCGTVRASAGPEAPPGRRLSHAELTALVDRLGLGGRPDEHAPGVPFDRLRVQGLQMQIANRDSGAPYLAVYQLDLLVEPRGEVLHMSGVGRLMSVFLRDEPVPFALAASMSPANLGLEVALPGSLQLDTPAGSVSFEEVSVSVGDQADVRLGKVVVLPRLLDVTEAWHADSVAATLSLSVGIVPEAVVVEGLKGELDLVALSALASWLAAEAEAGTALGLLERETDELRAHLNGRLSDVRGLLYGAAVSVRSADGDLRLTYRDGTTFSLARLDLDIGPSAPHDGSQLLVRYEGEAGQAEPRSGATSGSLEVPIRSLTPGGIVDWTE